MRGGNTHITENSPSNQVYNRRQRELYNDKRISIERGYDTCWGYMHLNI